jgi:hypothetical protein
MKRDRYADIRMHKSFYYSSIFAAAEGRRKALLVPPEDRRQVSLVVETVLEGYDCSPIRPAMEGAIELFPDDFGTKTKLYQFIPLVLPSPQDSTEEQEVIAVPAVLQRRVRFASTTTLQLYAMAEQERLMKRERWADIRLHLTFFHTTLRAAAEGQRRTLLRDARKQVALEAAKHGVDRSRTRELRLLNARAAAVMASIMSSSDDDFSEAWDEVFPNALKEALIGLDISIPSADLGCQRQVSLLVETVLEGCDCLPLRPVMEGAIELFPDDFDTQTKFSLFVPLVLPSPQDSMQELDVIAVPKEIFRPAFSIDRLDLKAVRSALRPIGELEEDESGLEGGGGIDFEEEEEMSPDVLNTVSFDLDKNVVHNVISLYEYSDEEYDACFRTDEEKEQSEREREKVVVRMHKSRSSTFRGTSRLYRGLETFTKKGEEEAKARVIAHCNGVLDEDESQFKSGSMNEEELRWVAEGLSERCNALAIERASTDRAEAEKVYAQGRRKPRRISRSQGTRASERLAARGLGSACTLSGRRFSNRLANKLKLV